MLLGADAAQPGREEDERDAAPGKETPDERAGPRGTPSAVGSEWRAHRPRMLADETLWADRRRRRRELFARGRHDHRLPGPERAGKTTTLRLLLGLAEPTAGEALVFAEVVQAVDQIVIIDRGQVVQSASLDALNAHGRTLEEAYLELIAGEAS